MKVIGFVATNRVGSKVKFEVEIPDEELEGLTEIERERWIGESVQDVMWDHVDWGWEEAESS